MCMDARHRPSVPGDPRDVIPMPGDPCDGIPMPVTGDARDPGWLEGVEVCDL